MFNPGRETGWQVRRFVTASGRCPFSEWIETLDEVIQARIYAYIIRVAAGGARRNVKSLGGRIHEIRVDAGPGYRVYLGVAGRNGLIVLLGGDKGSQRRDIQAAREYWSEFHAKD